MACSLIDNNRLYMCNSNYLKRNVGKVIVLSLCSILLLAQITAFSHELDHSKHDHQVSCDGFISYNSTSVAGGFLAPSVFIVSRLHYNAAKPHLFSPISLYSSQPIRAPPLFSLL